MVPGLAAADLRGTLVPTRSHSRAFIVTEARRWRTGAYRRRTPSHEYPTSTPSPHASTTRPFLSLSTPSLHAVAAIKDAAARLGKRLVQTDDDRPHSFDRHRQLVLFMF